MEAWNAGGIQTSSLTSLPFLKTRFLPDWGVVTITSLRLADDDDEGGVVEEQNLDGAGGALGGTPFRTGTSSSESSLREESQS